MARSLMLPDRAWLVAMSILLLGGLLRQGLAPRIRAHPPCSRRSIARSRPTIRSGATGSTDSARTRPMAFSSDAPSAAAASTRTWFSAWPSHRPSGSWRSNRTRSSRAELPRGEARPGLRRQRQRFGGPPLLRPAVDLPDHARRRPSRAAPSSGRRGSRPDRGSRRKASVRAHAASSSPGKPAIRSAWMATPGIARRSRATSCRVGRGVVAAAHAPQDRVVARLQRDVEVGQAPARRSRPRRRADRR